MLILRDLISQSLPFAFQTVHAAQQLSWAFGFFIFSPPSLLILFSLCGLPGMFCGEWGLSSPSGPCWPGFFCTAGTEFRIQRAERVKRWGAVALMVLAVNYPIPPWISGFIVMSYNQLLSSFTYGNGSLSRWSKLAYEKQPRKFRILFFIFLVQEQVSQTPVEPQTRALVAPAHLDTSAQLAPASPSRAPWALTQTGEALGNC